MQSFNLFQLHYKVGYAHHMKPTYYKSLYVSEKVLSTSPPLPQEFVETRWSYIHSALKWWNKYGKACVQVGHKVLASLPKSDSHYSIWKEIIQMAANVEIAVQRVLLYEVLERLIMPASEDCQKGDNELKFSSGFLARSWPVRVLRDTNMARLMYTQPDFALPLTTAAMQSLPAERHSDFINTAVKPFLDECVKTLNKHGTRWHTFPLLFALGADSDHRHFFWRAVRRVLGLPVDTSVLSGTVPSHLAQYDQPALYSQFVNAATQIKDAHELAKLCSNANLLDMREYLLGSQNVQWFAEFAVLAMVATDSGGLQKRMQKWPVPPDMMLEVATLAEQASASTPTSSSEPHTWHWYCTYVFAIPVNNAVAERQFNIAQLYTSSNECELSKQATHLFVENVVHKTSARLQYYQKGHKSATKATASSMHHIAQQMKLYSASITPARLRAAKREVKLLRSGQSDARTRTAAEVYSDSLRRHRVRTDIDSHIAELEEAGRIRSVDREKQKKASSSQSTGQSAEISQSK